VINASLTKKPEYKDRYEVIKRLCLIGGGLLFGRFFLISYLTGYSTMDVSDFKSTEWLRGDKLCTFKGRYHLAWSVPMADPTYMIPGAAIHSFCMFAPFFALYEKRGMVVQGTFLFIFGPYLAGWISPNLMEQASIWCFFSIAQISIMLFFIRETLIINWGRGGSHQSLVSGAGGDSNGKHKNGKETNGKHTNGKETNGKETNGKETNGKHATGKETNGHGKKVKNGKDKLN